MSDGSHLYLCLYLNHPSWYKFPVGWQQIYSLLETCLEVFLVGGLPWGLVHGDMHVHTGIHIHMMQTSVLESIGRNMMNEHELRRCVDDSACIVYMRC